MTGLKSKVRCIEKQWPCLPRDWLGFVKSPKKIFSKSTSIFLLFISHQSLFITFQIKKSLQNKKFHFSIQNILTFFLLSIKSATVPIHFFQSNPFPNTTSSIGAGMGRAHPTWSGRGPRGSINQDV
jgi:hypothetical protein